MKNILHILLISMCLYMLPSLVSAQQPTPDSSPTTVQPTTAEKNSLDETIQQLKNKIEKKVDQINKKSKSVIKGVINKVDQNLVEIADDNQTTYTVNFDDAVTVFYTADVSGLSKEDTAPKLSKGETLIITGPLLENQISANGVYIQTNYLTEQGQITNVDKDNFTVDVVTSNKDLYTLDIEEGTAQKLMNSKTLELSKAGFSKYKIGDRIHFVIEKPADNKKKVPAVRTLIIPQEFFTEGHSDQ